MGTCLGILLGVISPHHALLVPTEKLATLPNVLVVDTRPLTAYTEGHLANAIHLDVTTLSETRGGVAGLLKPLDQVRKALGDAGIDPAKHIVVYSGMKTADDLKDATRMFWILEYVGYDRVSVLDGGFAKWKAENRPVETGEPAYSPIEMPELHIRANRIVMADDVAKALTDGSAMIADMRGAEYFTGAKKADIVKEAGHIPNAVNLPAESLVESESNTVKPALELEELLKSSAILGNRKVITYCNSGRSASVGYFILRNLGKEDVAMYDGSMSEWTSDGNRPVVCDVPAPESSSIQNRESKTQN